MVVVPSHRACQVLLIGYPRGTAGGTGGGCEHAVFPRLARNGILMSGGPEATRRSFADGGFGAAMIGVAGLVMWGLRNQPKAPYDPVGAAAFPFWTAALVMALGALLVIRVLLRRSTRGEAAAYFVSTEAIDDSYSVRPGLSVVAAAGSFAYAVAMPLVGFAVASATFMFVLGWLLCDRTPRALAAVAAVALVGGFGLDAGFRAMMISLP